MEITIRSAKELAEMMLQSSNEPTIELQEQAQDIIDIATQISMLSQLERIADNLEGINRQIGGP